MCVCLLSFLLLHQASVCNTWCQKRNIHKWTWQYPKSKQWSCIDYVIVRQKDKAMCTNVTVRHGTVCYTDHQLVCATVQLSLVTFGKRPRRCSTSGRFDVSKLLVCRGESIDFPVARGFVESVLARAGAEDGGVEDKWLAVQAALCTLAEDLLGRSR